MQLDLQLKTPGTIFGPNDSVDGIVKFTTPGTILVSEISVVFSGINAHEFSPYRSVDTEYSLKLPLFQERKIFYSSEKLNPKPPLPIGLHE